MSWARCNLMLMLKCNIIKNIYFDHWRKWKLYSREQEEGNGINSTDNVVIGSTTPSWSAKMIFDLLTTTRVNVYFASKTALHCTLFCGFVSVFTFCLNDSKNTTCHLWNSNLFFQVKTLYQLRQYQYTIYTVAWCCHLFTFQVYY